MKKVSVLIISAIVLSLFAGCASIVSKSDWPVSITSQPSGSSITVTKSDGVEVYVGETPTTITLSAKRGYFKSETYTITFNKDGFYPTSYQLRSNVNGWYWGNFLLGGAIGMFIVDPLTGAMFHLEENVDVSLQADLSFVSEGKTLQIVSLDHVPEELKNSLIELNI